jgi:hypothetical protein
MDALPAGRAVRGGFSSDKDCAAVGLVQEGQQKHEGQLS